MAKIDFASSRGLLALQLFSAQLVKFGAFFPRRHAEQTDPPVTPIHFEFRHLQSPEFNAWEISARLQRSFRETVNQIGFDVLCGIPDSGIPITNICATSYKPLPAPIIQLGKSEAHGTQRVDTIVDRAHTTRDNIVLLVDDIIATAHSKAETIELLRTNGLIVNTLFVIVDLQMGGVKTLERIGVHVQALYTLSELTEFYFGQNLISEAIQRDVQEHIRSSTQNSQ